MILDDIVQSKKKRLLEHKANIPLEEMIELAQNEKRESISFYQALKKEGLSIIGEFKKASPSLGDIVEQIDLKERINLYNKSVDAISCLTEEDYFKGDVKYLKFIREQTSLPILRKDFMIDPYQFYEAKVIGADAVLLIAAILKEEQLFEFYELSQKLKLDVLIEVHDANEMERVLQLNPKIIGVNNRNLKDFTISLDTTKDLCKMIPEGTAFVSESGILNEADVEELKTYPIDAFLVGRAFMESKNPMQIAKEWKEAFG